MNGEFHTLHEFLFRAEGVTYLLIAGFLIGFVWFYRFLTARDPKEEEAE